MTVLDCAIPKAEWLHEVGHRNGVSLLPAPPTGEKGDAGNWEPTVQKLVGFQHLGDDWDGAGAKAPARDLLASAVGLAYLLLEKGVEPPHRVVPGLEGEVIWEWQFPDGTYGEIEIVHPLYAEVMMIEPGKPARHWTLPTE
jgi:hypothetical protein